MECRDAQFYLRLKRHHAAGSDELGADVAASLNGHLATCPACAADAGGAASFDRAVASAMRRVPLPAGLREQLVAHVAAKQGAILRGKLYRSAIAAAAAVVLVFLGIGMFSSTRPKPDPDQLAQEAGSQYSEPKESTERWLAAQKLPTDLPLPFDYTLRPSHDIVKMWDYDIPVIAFYNNGEFAKVYILRNDGRPDPNALRDAQDSHATVKIMRDSRVTYMIVYTGGPNGLEQFLITRRAGMRPL